jgi:site-specific recombinase XerD
MGSTAVQISEAGGRRTHDGWKIITSLVLDGISSRHTRRAYSQALDEFLIWFHDEPGREFNKATVQTYRTELETKGLAPSSINVRLSAIRRLALEAADNGLMAPELAAGIARAKGAKRSGVRLGHWLTAEQADKLLALPDLTTLKGIRDSAVLAVLVGAGLRRSELAALNVDHVQNRETRWLIADLVGKHGRIRSVPIPPWAHTAIARWETAASITDGAVFRRVNRHGHVTPGRISAQAVFEIVKSYAARLEFEVGRHDLRRSLARLAHLGQSPLEQIQLSLGHASVVTTEIYLGVKQNLHDAPCDHLGLVHATDGPNSI